MPETARPGGSADPAEQNAANAAHAAEQDGNRLVPLLGAGRAPRAVFAAIAAEESRIVRSDQRSFLTLAARCEDAAGRALYSGLAAGEAQALGRLSGLCAATGMDEDGPALRAYRPRPGCQAYPAYLAWLSLNGEPADVTVALMANFAAWGGYCAAVASAMRTHYGFDDEACAFFDFFAAPAPAIEEQAAAVVRAGREEGRLTGEADTYARLLQAYELMFWNTLADVGRTAEA